MRRSEFQRATERLWEEQLGEDHSMNFADMETQIHYLLNAVELPESQRSVTLGTLITAYEAEKSRFQAVQDLSNKV
jgi:hypothetical protein